MEEERRDVTSTSRRRAAELDARLESLYREQRTELVRLAYLITRSEAVAEDVVHDSFLRLGSANGQVVNSHAYLRQIVVNQARQHLRRAKVEREHLPDPPPPVLPPELDEMWRLLDKLSPNHRTALVLRYYEDLPFAEIARLMDCRVNTARSLVHRALKRLRRMLDAQPE